MSKPKNGECNISWTIESAVEDEAIEKIDITHSSYSFWLKGIPTEIRVVLSINPVQGGYNFNLSHHIHTPRQIGPYHPSNPWGDDKAYALHQAVTAITQYYRQALDAGYEPNEKWLIPGENGI